MISPHCSVEWKSEGRCVNQGFSSNGFRGTRVRVPFQVILITGVPARRARQMTPQTIEVWTPRRLFAALVAGLSAAPRPAAVLVPLKRDA